MRAEANETCSQYDYVGTSYLRVSKDNEKPRGKPNANLAFVMTEDASIGSDFGDFVQKRFAFQPDIDVS